MVLKAELKSTNRILTWGVQVLWGEVEGHVNCVVPRPVASVGKLQGVQESVCGGFEVCQHQALKKLHYHRGQGDGPVVNQSCWPWLVVGDLPEPSPDRSRVVSRELVFQSL